jgi:response regulator of citrate/malate metabolism
MMDRIICVDDDPLCLFLAEMTIKESNYANEILLAESAPAAITLLNTLFSRDNQNLDSEEEPATLIFLDINMPGMNGWDFLETYEKEFRHLFGLVRIIILSSSIDTADMIRSRQYQSVADYIVKPLTVDVLNKLKSAIAA